MLNGLGLEVTVEKEKVISFSFLLDARCRLSVCSFRMKRIYYLATLKELKEQLYDHYKYLQNSY